MGRGTFLNYILAAILCAAMLFPACSANQNPDENPSLSYIQDDAVPEKSNSPGDRSFGGDSEKDSESEENSGITVYFIDVGQADCALIECGGEYMLIDGGNSGDSNLLYSFLKNHDITYLDYVIGTHMHEDHIGGIPGALRFADAGKVYCSETFGSTRVADSFIKAVKKKGLEITLPQAGETFPLGSAMAEIIGPIDYSRDDTNELSIVLKITYEETSFLFTGDAGRDEERDILESGCDLESTVLKVGHHGSRNSTTYPFLREIMPAYAVISVGKDNDYGHPADDTLSRLRDAGVTVFRTDLDGDIVCTSDGKTVIFETQKQRPPGTEAQEILPPADPRDGNQKDSSEGGYLANSNSMKFHEIYCKTGQRTAEKNRVFFGTRDAAIAQGYVPAKCCNP